MALVKPDASTLVCLQTASNLPGTEEQLKG